MRTADWFVPGVEPGEFEFDDPPPPPHDDHNDTATTTRKSLLTRPTRPATEVALLTAHISGFASPGSQCLLLAQYTRFLRRPMKLQDHKQKWRPGSRHFILWDFCSIVRP